MGFGCFWGARLWTRWTRLNKNGQDGLSGDYDFANPVNPEILSKSMMSGSLGRSFLDKMGQEWLSGAFDPANLV
jgi:hypothetical protein